MTTHETRPENFDPTAEAPVRQDRQMEAGATDERDTVGEQRPTGDFQRAQDVVASPSREPDRTLFAEGEMSDLRSRWTEVQAGFVDDPRDCVQKADGLVSDVVDRLTAGFAQARSALEEQWSRGEEASTEDLRVALQRYRAFFERLLAV